MASKTTTEHTQKFASKVNECRECGYCTFWCPVYQEQPLESSVARGKNKMIKALLAGQTGYTPEFADRLNKCLLCMSCTEHCPVRVETPDIVLAARADKCKVTGLSLPYRVVFRWLVPYRTLFGNAVRVASWLQGIFMPKTKGTIRHLSFFLSALGEGRHIPSIAPKFLRQMVPVINKPPSGVPTKVRVGYFTGCLFDFVFPEVARKTIHFLTKNGVEVMVPRDQGCCGVPVFLGAGDFETGRKLADSNVKAFAEVDYVVSACATCTSALKDYEKFLADSPPRAEAYAQFGRKLKDITEFLVDVLQLPASAYQASPEARGLKVTWHDPCHLIRHLKIKNEPRQILNSIPDVEYVEMVRPDWCCGMGGTFSIPYYDISRKVADRKMETIRATEADAVVTDCPGCMMQLIDGITRQKMPQKVMHIMELLQ